MRSISTSGSRRLSPGNFKEEHMRPRMIEIPTGLSDLCMSSVGPS